MRNPKSETTSTNQVLGGILGAVGGVVFLYFAMHLGTLILRSDSILLKLFGIVLSICNLVGVAGYPLLGFAIGYKYMFTTTRTRIDK